MNLNEFTQKAQEAVLNAQAMAEEANHCWQRCSSRATASCPRSSTGKSQIDETRAQIEQAEREANLEEAARPRYGAASNAVRRSATYPMSQAGRSPLPWSVAWAWAARTPAGG